MYPPLWTSHLVAMHDDIGNRSMREDSWRDLVQRPKVNVFKIYIKGKKMTLLFFFGFRMCLRCLLIDGHALFVVRASNDIIQPKRRL